MTELEICPLGDPVPELSLYREHSLALLHRYFLVSVEAGRLPALLGREVFRARARSYRLTSFEDLVIFVHDVERCLNRLSSFDQELITRIVFQEYTQEEAAALLGCSARTVERRFPEALDGLTEMFLAKGMLKPSTRRYRHLDLDQARAPGVIDLQACAAWADEVEGEALPLDFSFLAEQLVKPPFFAFCS